MKRPFLISFIIVLILSILTGFVRWNYIELDCYISFSVFFIAAYLLILKYSHQQKKITIYFIISIILLDFISWGVDGEFPILGLPNTSLMMLGCITAYLFSTFKSYAGKIVTLVCGLAICSLVFFNYDKWLHYLNYGNISGEVQEQERSSWSAYNKFGDTINAQSFKNKIVLLDFWNTGCLVCFTKFPQLQKLYEEYQNDTTVLIQSINIPWEGDKPNIAFDALEKKHYTFPAAVAIQNMDSVFKVTVYPTVIILNNGKPVFRGELEKAAILLKEIATTRH